MKKLHHDLFVGEIAEEMNKQGVFGTEINLYCFLYWDGISFFDYFCEDRNHCVKKILSYLQKGWFVSNYNIMKRRIYAAKEQVWSELLQEMRTIILREELPILKEQVVLYNQKTYVSKEKQITDFLHTITDGQKPIINDLLGRCLRKKAISKDFYNKFYYPKAIKDFSSIDSEVAGFAWLENGEVNYYVNAYLPTVWEKLYNKQKQALCSSIYTLTVNIEQNFTAVKAKDKLKEILPTVFTNDYFKLLIEIEAK